MWDKKIFWVSAKALKPEHLLCSQLLWKCGGGGFINPESTTFKLFLIFFLYSQGPQSHLVSFLAKASIGKQSTRRGPGVISQLNYMSKTETTALWHWKLIAKMLLKGEIREVFNICFCPCSQLLRKHRNDTRSFSSLPLLSACCIFLWQFQHLWPGVLDFYLLCLLAFVGSTAALGFSLS